MRPWRNDRRVVLARRPGAAPLPRRKVARPEPAGGFAPVGQPRLTCGEVSSNSGRPSHDISLFCAGDSRWRSSSGIRFSASFSAGTGWAGRWRHGGVISRHLPPASVHVVFYVGAVLQGSFPLPD